MGADSARHYQWYPFMNMGHYHLTKVNHTNISKEFARNMHSGIQRTYEKAVESPFLHGIPYIWCSNNLTTAMLTQCRLYRETTGDESYAEMEAALRDWLFGCNPWGTSMIVELPLYGDYPIQSHSSYVMDRVANTTGGIVDGPVYSNIFNNLIGVSLKGLPWQPGEDYARFQPDRMVYHDAIGDYSTNECTMDGTACLTYYLSSMQADGMKQAQMEADKNVYVNDGIIRTNPAKKQITLVFTADDKADGAETIIRTLEKEGIQGAFFFTGKFYELYPEIIKTLVDKGHYVGGHSYGHLLYMPWENPDSLLVTREEFEADMMKSYDLMRKAGIEYKDAPFYIPPYEYYNKEISAWAKSMGIQVVNFTPGTGTNADYTTPDMKNYRSSKAIYDKIMEVEKKEGLNGHLMLIHFGTHDNRTDKFYKGYMEKMIKTLKRKGYTFAPIREAVGF
jgi:peptidoglycan/xylan/chitin deacetylase (PgdA/CDA1 family)